MCVIALPEAELARRVWVFPPDIVPVVHMFAQNDKVCRWHRLKAVQLSE